MSGQHLSEENLQDFMHVNKRWYLCNKLTTKTGYLKLLIPASTVDGTDLAALLQALICGQSVLDTLHITLRVKTCWNLLALGLNDIIRQIRPYLISRTQK